jgi:hypothetical protein
VCILVITSALKVISLVEADALLLGRRDPLLCLPTNITMALAIVVELATCAMILWSRGWTSRGLVLATVGAQFVLYHVALALIGGRGGCPCLGNLWQWLRVSPLAADRASLCLAHLICLSGAYLAFIGHKYEPRMPH